MQTNNVNVLISLNALHADEIEKNKPKKPTTTETGINPIIVKKEPETSSLFPDLHF